MGEKVQKGLLMKCLSDFQKLRKVEGLFKTLIEVYKQMGHFQRNGPKLIYQGLLLISI